MQDHRSDLSQLRTSIHDKWERYESYVLRDLDTPGRNRFFGASDALWDMDDALRGIWRGLPANSQLAKLAAYGALQALVVQQDAVQSFWTVVKPERGWKPKAFLELEKIRVLRHRLSGHIAYADQSGGTASIIDVGDQHVIAGTIYGLKSGDPAERSPRYPIKDLILTNAKVLAEQLRPIDSAMNTPALVFDRLRKGMGGDR
jgi:hypothetical protein